MFFPLIGAPTILGTRTPSSTGLGEREDEIGHHVFLTGAQSNLRLEIIIWRLLQISQLIRARD